MPCRQIAYNAGVDADAVVSKVLSMSRDEGYNALTGEYVDMVKAGIIDPTKVISGTFPFILLEIEVFHFIHRICRL